MFFRDLKKNDSYLAEPDGKLSVSFSKCYRFEKDRLTRTQVIDELVKSLEEETIFIVVGNDTASYAIGKFYSLTILLSAKEISVNILCFS